MLLRIMHDFTDDSHDLDDEDCRHQMDTPEEVVGHEECDDSDGLQGGEEEVEAAEGRGGGGSRRVWVKHG